MTVSSPQGHNKVATYCYQCVGPDLLKVKVEDDVATAVEPNFDAEDVHPAAQAGSRVKAFGLVQKDLQPEPRPAADEAHQPEGRHGGPVSCPSHGTGARHHRRQTARHPADRPARRPGLPACGELRQRHAHCLHGHLPACWRPGAGGHELRQRPGRQVLPPSTSTASSGTAPSSSVRTPRIHPVPSAATSRASGGVCGVWRHAAARVEQGVKRRPGRPHPVGHRRLLRRVAADQPRPTPPCCSR